MYKYLKIFLRSPLQTECNLSTAISYEFNTFVTEHKFTCKKY